MNIWDQLLGGLLALLLLLGLPLFILRLRDRSRFGRAASVASGVAALLVGLLMAVAVVWQVVESKLSLADLTLRSVIPYAGQGLMSALFIFMGIKWIRDEGPDIDEYPIDDEEPEIRASVTQARQTLPYFVEQVRNHVDDALCRFALEMDANDAVHVWGSVHGFDRDHFDVSLVGHDRKVAKKHPARMRIHRDAVEDWQIIGDDGRLRGGYSYIAKFSILKRKGYRFHKRLREQLADFIDAPDGGRVPGS